MTAVGGKWLTRSNLNPSSAGFFSMPPRKGTKAREGKGKRNTQGSATSDEEMKDVNLTSGSISPVVQPTNPADDIPEDIRMGSSRDSTPVTSKPGLTPQERVAKMAALRERMVCKFPFFGYVIMWLILLVYSVNLPLQTDET